MSIERTASHGAQGDAERARMTERGREEMRTNLIAQAVWWEARGDWVRGKECREQAEALIECPA